MGRESPSCAVIEAAYFKQMCDTAGIALVAVDEHRRIRYGNDKAAELLKVPAQRMLGTSLAELVKACGAGTVEQLVEGAFAGRPCTETELKLTGGGSVKYWAVTVCGARDSAGVVTGASVSLRDITRRVQNQEQMGQARKMRALGSLAGNIAHHFNNILGGVVTSVDFAMESSDIRVLKKTLRGTAEALQRATHLLDGLLAFAEADYRDSDLADLTETILHSVARIRQELQEKNIQLDLELSQIPVIEVPGNQFLMVLANLYDNAVDAMPDGGRLLLQLEPKQDHVVCRVIDSGRGIAVESLEHVFEPFYSTKEPGAESRWRHHGLGLSVAMGIIHEIGGEISIHSQPGLKTTVEIRLPLDSRLPLQKNKPASGGSGGIESVGSGRQLAGEGPPPGA